MITTHIKAFALGMYEFRCSFITPYGPTYIETYDSGRAFAHFVTLGMCHK